MFENEECAEQSEKDRCLKKLDDEIVDGFLKALNFCINILEKVKSMQCHRAQWAEPILSLLSKEGKRKKRARRPINHVVLRKPHPFQGLDISKIINFTR